MAIKRETPEVNAGSMADIAFLLLIFFLVTTTLETDQGLDRLLPSIENEPRTIDINEKNVLRVNLNRENQLMLEDEIIDIKILREIAIKFLDNGGSLPNEKNFCDYCNGNRDRNSSDNPNEAIISLTHKRKTAYGFYIAVQNELVGAYNDLRNRESQKLFHQDYVDMEEEYFDEKTHLVRKETLKKQIKIVRELFPQKIIESEVINN